MNSQEDVLEQLETLNEIGIALSSERDLDTLLDLIVREAMNVTSAEGGTLFVVDGDQLFFAVTRNEALDLHATSANDPSEEQALPITTDSISGYVAETGEVIRIDDAYDLPEDTPYSFDPSFDEEHDYRTQSLLGVPLDLHNDDVIGVLLLVNARDAEGNVISFPEEKKELIQSLASQAGVALHNAQLNEQLKESYLESIQRLSIAAEYKDPDTAHHIRRMSQYSHRMVKELGWSDERAERMLYASTMHDIGKIGVPDQILLKPDTLTDDEFERMKEHTVIGHRILSGSDNAIMELSARIALTHHEKWDGKGYPNGISGEEIPVEGRVVAVADVFDALTTERPYKKAFPIEKSVEIIKDDSGSHFDPEMVSVFDSCLDDLLEIRKNFTDGTSATNG